MNIKNRITQLEKRLDEQPQAMPQVIEIYGMRMDGTQYLSERREFKNGSYVTVEKHISQEQTK